jgi:hypothetical protein
MVSTTLPLRELVDFTQVAGNDGCSLGLGYVRVIEAAVAIARKSMLDLDLAQ